MINKGLKYVCLGFFILICISLGIYNLINNQEFFKTSFSTIVSIIVAVVLSYFLAQRKTDTRRKKEKIDSLLYKIQNIMLSNDFYTVKTENLILQRSIANKIEYIEENIGSDFKDDIKRIKENFERYRNTYGNSYADSKNMNNSERELRNYIALIDDVCDKIHIKLS